MWSLLFLVLGLIINGSVFYFAPQYQLPVSLGVVFLLGLIALSYSNKSQNAKSALQREQARSSAIITSYVDGVIVYDKDFRILVFSPSAEKILGVPRKEVLGKRFSVDSGKNPALAVFAQVLFPSLALKAIVRSEPNEEPQVVDLVIENPSLDLRVITARITDSASRIIGFCKIIVNRTRELSLLQSKNAFLDIAARQLQNPISSILQSLQQIHLEIGTRESLISARKSAEKIQNIISDLTDIVKIEEGQFGYKFQKFNLDEFAEDLLEKAIPLAQIHNVKLYLEKTEENLEIYADKDRLALVFSNLIDNAMKYNVPNGEVTISLSRVPDRPFVSVSVQDTGLGIPAEETERLFQKFFRGKNVLQKTEGSGLGLYIVKNVINRHSGQIWLGSELNRGTTFYFTLPTEKSLIPTKDIDYTQ